MNGVEMIGRMMLALGVVLAIMWALAKWSKRGRTGGRNGEVLDILARQQISRAASVAVIKVGDRAIVVGVTEQAVQMLTEADLSQIEQTLAIDDDEPERIRGGRRVFADHLAALTEADDDEAIQDVDDETGTATGIRTVSRPAGSRTVARSRSGSGRRRAATAGPRGGFESSVLSPKMWRQLIDGARDLTVRR